METLVSRDELVGEGQSRHETPLLEPEYRCKCSAEEDTFDGCERDKPLSEGGVLILDPFDGPVSLLSDGGNCLMSDRDQTRRDGRLTGFDSIEEISALLLLFDVCIDEE